MTGTNRVSSVVLEAMNMAHDKSVSAHNGNGQPRKHGPFSSRNLAGKSLRDPVRDRNLVQRFLGFFGPGVITGASDDDPSGIGTYSAAGASLGYATLWTALV